jgi:protein-S-isoprenylcysteine O-methyltransferase Ste14
VSDEHEGPGAWRQARAIALLPGTVCVLLPVLALVRWGTNIGWGLDGVAAALPVLLGLALIAAGFSLWLWTVRVFALVGRGTLAPWDPTERLVVVGPYRRLRNPMISGVLAVLLGEAALFGSPPLLIWAAIFFSVNQAWFVLHEEPALERRYGGPYRAYRREVPRWLPRRRG